MIICPKCGASHADGVSFCQKCGNNLAAMAQPAAPAFQAQPQVNPGQPNVAPNTFAPGNNMQPKKPIDKKFIFIGAGAAAALVVLILLIVLLSKPGYVKSVNKLEKAINKHDFVAIENLCIPKDAYAPLQAYVEKNYWSSYTSSEIIEMFTEYITDIDSDDLFEMSNIKFKVLSKRKLSDYELAQFNSEDGDSYLACAGIVYKKVYAVTVSVSGVIGGQPGSSVGTIYVGQYKGKWYIADMD